MACGTYRSARVGAISSDRLPPSDSGDADFA